RSIQGEGFSDQPELAQFARHRGRQIVIVGKAEKAIWRRVFRFEIAPTLERLPRHDLRRDDLPVELDEAVRPSLLVDVAGDAEDTLPGADLAADHPEEGAAGEQLLPSLRRVPRMDEKALLGPPALGPARLELLEIVDADAELDELERHQPAFAASACAALEAGGRPSTPEM